MRAWIRALLLAVLVGAAAGACTREGAITAPQDGAVMDGAATQDTIANPQNDTTGGRWGGFIGSGG